MPQERSKGQAGMGGRGKNQKQGRQDQATAKRKRNAGNGVTLEAPSEDPKDNQGRNQRAWKMEKKLENRY